MVWDQSNNKVRMGRRDVISNVRKTSIIAIFIALTVIGAFIKIPAIIGSVALDSFPALLAAAFFGPFVGAIVAGLGHMVSAVLGGMPLGPLHIIVAIEMAVLVSLYAVFYHHKKKVIAGIVFLIGNTFIAPMPFIFLIDVAFYIAIVPSLLIGSLLNLIIAFVIIPRLSDIFQEAYFKGEVKG